MKNRNLLLICLVLVALVATGCNSQAAPQVVREEIPVTVVVPQTVEVTREVTRVVTRVVTATSRPATPTPPSTPTPVVVVPAGWITYTNPTGLFTVRLPPGAKITDETINAVTTHLANGIIILIFIVDSPGGQVGDEDAINGLVKQALTGQNRLDNVQVIAKGAWRDPIQANYVELVITDYVYKIATYQINLSVPATAITHIEAAALRIVSELTDQEKADFGRIIASVRLTE